MPDGRPFPRTLGLPLGLAVPLPLAASYSYHGRVQRKISYMIPIRRLRLPAIDPIVRSTFEHYRGGRCSVQMPRAIAPASSAANAKRRYQGMNWPIRGGWIALRFRPVWFLPIDSTPIRTPRASLRPAKYGGGRSRYRRIVSGDFLAGWPAAYYPLGFITVERHFSDKRCCVLIFLYLFYLYLSRAMPPCQWVDCQSHCDL
ncbi:hypothetical protein BO94DRAFT_232227 [Aspergillus sclerotioniger CBS 115572]|uniref:Uncharacterized protein n=1 Tax=Aspergillus sclerotioniger CBS 115572 TaxID=1450535 RepID=A0A317VPH1_9EURO|nr:hypothetical protein BO94DRAFT_232227 [Aspergillus sclerotioniger CBS 115572]PWY73750.1 hypothetical protein BO94DRAFT_232227 [Aspergillus sclerotioniger CBS 115572]